MPPARVSVLPRIKYSNYGRSSGPVLANYQEKLHGDMHQVGLRLGLVHQFSSFSPTYFPYFIHLYVLYDMHLRRLYRKYVAVQIFKGSSRAQDPEYRLLLGRAEGEKGENVKA